MNSTDVVLTIIKDNSPWPMVHFFVPGMVFFYLQLHSREGENVWWKFISIIYFFESFEYLLSLIFGSVFMENSHMDSLVSDIVMAIFGAFSVSTLYKDINYERIDQCTVWPFAHIVFLSCSFTGLIVLIDGKMDSIPILNCLLFAFIYMSASCFVAYFKYNFLMFFLKRAFVTFIIMCALHLCFGGYTLVSVTTTFAILMALYFGKKYSDNIIVFTPLFLINNPHWSRPNATIGP